MDDSIKRAVERAERGELDPGPWKFPPDARSIVCYFRGVDGDEVTGWHNGAQVQASHIRVRGDDVFGTVRFDVPKGTTTLTLDHENRRAIFT